MTVSPIPAASNACRGVTSVTSYEAAERAVDWLSDHSFPVEHVSIVGTGLRYVEQIGGRLTTGRAALTGTAQGAMIGLFWGLIFGLLFTVDGAGFFGVLAYSVAVGAVFGADARQRRRPSPRSNPGERRRQIPQRSRSRQVGRALTTTSPSSPIHTSSTTARCRPARRAHTLVPRTSFRSPRFQP
jgi:hypothetical protein